MNLERRAKDLVLATWSLSGGFQAKRLSRTYNLPDGFDRIYFWHIRKTAGTSLNRAFLALGGEAVEPLHLRLQNSLNKRVFSGGKVIVGHNRYLIRQGRYYYAFSHQPMHALKLPPRTFAITCLRDPVQRVLSHYRMLAGLRREKSNIPSVRLHGYKAEGTIGDYLRLTPRHELLQQIYMFSQSLDPAEAARKIASCNVVLHTETFSDDLARLAEALQQPLQTRHDRKSPDDIPFDEADLAQLREAMQPEYDMLEHLRVIVPASNPRAIGTGR